jgi:hypothetical protein
MYACRDLLSPLPLFALALGSSLLCSPAKAQPTSPRVAVVRATNGVTQELADEIDAALLRELSAVGGIESPVVSPVDYAEIEIGVGCSDDFRACLLAITRAVRVDALVLRRLSLDAQGQGRLELTYFDAASNDAPTIVEATVPATQLNLVLVEAVPMLVRRLFGIEAVAPPAAPPTAEVAAATTAPSSIQRSAALAPAREAGVSAHTWIALGAGAATLTAGIVLGWTAQQDFRDWKQTPLQSRAEADAARSAYEDIHTRAIAADVLMPVGAAALGLGLTLLVIDLEDEAGSDVRNARIELAPAPAGAMLRVHGVLQDVP